MSFSAASRRRHRAERDRDMGVMRVTAASLQLAAQAAPPPPPHVTAAVALVPAPRPTSASTAMAMAAQVSANTPRVAPAVQLPRVVSHLQDKVAIAQNINAQPPPVAPVVYEAPSLVAATQPDPTPPDVQPPPAIDFTPPTEVRHLNLSQELQDAPPAPMPQQRMPRQRSLVPDNAGGLPPLPGAAPSAMPDATNSGSGAAAPAAVTFSGGSEGAAPNIAAPGSPLANLAKWAPWAAVGALALYLALRKR